MIQRPAQKQSGLHALTWCVLTRTTCQLTSISLYFSNSCISDSSNGGNAVLGELQLHSVCAQNKSSELCPLHPRTKVGQSYKACIDLRLLFTHTFSSICSCCTSYGKNNLSIYLNFVCNKTATMIGILGKLIGAPGVNIDLSNGSNLAPAVCPSMLLLPKSGTFPYFVNSTVWQVERQLIFCTAYYIYNTIAD